jgi:excisionase family DNA binding protein
MSQEQIVIKREDFNQFIREVLSNTNEKALLTTKEAAKYLRCSLVTFWKIRKSGDINHVLVGKKLLFNKADLDNYLNQEKEVVNG